MTDPTTSEASLTLEPATAEDLAIDLVKRYGDFVRSPSPGECIDEEEGMSLVRRCAHAEKLAGEFRAALVDMVDTCERLADQQAMPDDFYELHLAEAISLLKKTKEQS